MNDIVFTLEFDDDAANDRANEYLKKDWKLLHVGTKLTGIIDSGQACYNTVYVVGANQAAYDAYQKEQEEFEKNDNF